MYFPTLHCLPTTSTIFFPIKTHTFPLPTSVPVHLPASCLCLIYSSRLVLPASFCPKQEKSDSCTLGKKHIWLSTIIYSLEESAAWNSLSWRDTGGLLITPKCPNYTTYNRVPTIIVTPISSVSRHSLEEPETLQFTNKRAFPWGYTISTGTIPYHTSPP